MIGRTSMLVAAIVLSTAPKLFACAGHGNNTAIAVLPGGGVLSEWAGPAMIVLAAFLKRPFISMAGIGSQALWRSIQSTLLSSMATTAVGVASLMLLFSSPPVGLLAVIAMPLLGALVDWAWLARPGMGASKPVSYGWLAAGNYVSAFVIFTLPIWVSAFRFDSGAHLWWARSTAPSVGMMTVVGVVLLLVHAFACAPRDRNAPGLYRSGRAFEVILPDSAPQSALIEDAIVASPLPAPRST